MIEAVPASSGTSAWPACRPRRWRGSRRGDRCRSARRGCRGTQGTNSPKKRAACDWLERLLHRPRRGEGVEALVHPGVLEFVAAHDPVPALMARLVHRHLRVCAPRGEPAGAAGEERRVFHAVGRLWKAGSTTVMWPYGYGAEPLAVMFHAATVAAKWRSACPRCSGCSSRRISTAGSVGCVNVRTSRKRGLAVHAKSWTSSPR